MPGQLRAERRREAILEAALSLIGERGTAAVTHRAVAERAGVAVGSITYYFSSTAGLLEAALELAAELERARIMCAVPDDPRDIRRWVGALAGHLTLASAADRDRRLAAFELVLESAREPRLRPVLESWLEDYRSTAQSTLAAAGSDDPIHDAHLLVSALLGLDLAQAATGGAPRSELEATIERFIRRLLESSSPSRRST